MTNIHKYLYLSISKLKKKQAKQVSLLYQISIFENCYNPFGISHHNPLHEHSHEHDSIYI